MSSHSAEKLKQAIKDTGSAFPVVDANRDSYGQEGMSLRIYVATQVMNSLISSPWDSTSLGLKQIHSGQTIFENCAENSLLFADALIAESKK